jgi:hypothetical protein
MALPLIPHSDLDPDCCGCICQVMENDGPRFICNECAAVISKEAIARLVLEMDSCEATCSHCGHVNEFQGFSEMLAFRCRFCGEGVSV